MAAPQFDVVVIGSLNLDLVARTPRLPGPGETVSGTSYTEFAGGKGLNQAVAAARSGGRVAMIGAVGDDHAGQVLRSVVTDDGIDDTAIATVGGTPTGRAMIAVDDHAENSIIVIPGANASVSSPAVPPTTVVLAQLEVPVERVLEAFTIGRAAGAITVLNPAPAQSLPDEVLAVCDIVVPNEHELDLIGGSEHLFGRGVGTVIVTLGARGAELRTSDGGVTAIEPFDVRPVDTTGAGDAFCGSLAARLAVGESVEHASTWAAAAGALATTVAGAVPAQPRASAIRAQLDERPQQGRGD